MERSQEKKKSNLAGTVLDDDVSVLADSTGLLGIGLGSSGVGLGLEVVLVVRHGRGDRRDLKEATFWRRRTGKKGREAESVRKKRRECERIFIGTDLSSL